MKVEEHEQVEKKECTKRKRPVGIIILDSCRRSFSVLLEYLTRTSWLSGYISHNFCSPHGARAYATSLQQPGLKSNNNYSEKSVGKYICHGEIALCIDTQSLAHHRGTEPSVFVLMFISTFKQDWASSNNNHPTSSSSSFIKIRRVPFILSDLLSPALQSLFLILRLSLSGHNKISG